VIFAIKSAVKTEFDSFERVFTLKLLGSKYQLAETKPANRRLTEMKNKALAKLVLIMIYLGLPD